MCGRFTLIDFEEIAERFQISDDSVELKPRYNIAPSQEIPVILNQGSNSLAFFQWGLIPSWAKDPAIGNKMINARVETIDEKPAFKSLLRQKRCLIPADGFYEWKRSGTFNQPYRITLKNNRLFSFAGLWDTWSSPTGEVINSCTVITTTSNELIETIHTRMPAILTPEQEKLWLDPKITDSQFLKSLLRPYPSDLMTAYEVSKIVNSPKYDQPECIEPFEDNSLFKDFK
ncbi:SOS response-associated peptidase [Desulfitobacterium sp. Sab5]|uniref:SOS response-associated peptidase n=1 Tax=Desulfitobacterium nosdiversum TaxID=3375356 RepID=UPI003CE6A7F8